MAFVITEGRDMPTVDDLIYMLGELYMQRRMEQTKNQQLTQAVETQAAEIQRLNEQLEQQGGGNVVVD